MSNPAPRVVFVSRQTEYASLLATHGTRGQAEFFLSARGQSIADVEDKHKVQDAALSKAKALVPADWSFAHVDRDDLDRFLFFPSDIVVAIGQDGLVANLAKYLDGQSVIGVAPDPGWGVGVLTRTDVGTLKALLPAAANQAVSVENRTMVQAMLSGGQSLVALNELFVGHQSHQSARYDLQFGDKSEYQSSSGIIISTGTGLTGWAKSILAATRRKIEFAPTDRAAAFFAREPWPSAGSGNALMRGKLVEGRDLMITSRMNDHGVIFADGIEGDYLPFAWGDQLIVALADKTLHLVADK